MGMDLLLVKLTPAQAEAVLANPEVLNDVFEEPETLPAPLAELDQEADVLDVNFLHISRYLDTEAAESPWLRKAVNGAGTILDVDFGYENCWHLTPPEVREMVAGIEQDGWFDPDPHLNGDVEALVNFYRTAGEQGRAVMGGVA